ISLSLSFQNLNQTKPFRLRVSSLHTDLAFSDCDSQNIQTSSLRCTSIRPLARALNFEEALTVEVWARFQECPKEGPKIKCAPFFRQASYLSSKKKYFVVGTKYVPAEDTWPPPETPKLPANRCRRNPAKSRSQA